MLFIVLLDFTILTRDRSSVLYETVDTTVRSTFKDTFKDVVAFVLRVHCGECVTVYQKPLIGESDKLLSCNRKAISRLANQRA